MERDVICFFSKITNYIPERSVVLLLMTVKNRFIDFKIGVV